jgi:UTP:GlnB (protein PII) uridylyltransferase
MLSTSIWQSWQQNAVEEILEQQQQRLQQQQQQQHNHEQQQREIEDIKQASETGKQTATTIEERASSPTTPRDASSSESDGARPVVELRRLLHSPIDAVRRDGRLWLFALVRAMCDVQVRNTHISPSQA